MKPFITVTSVVTPMEMSNVDTDQIIPKQFLKRIERTGYGEFLFHDWRQEPGFVLNFGCGSSREHAAWALGQYGFRAILAPSFADIFHSNAGKNGLLLVTLPEEKIEQILLQAKAADGYALTVSLEQNLISDAFGLRESFAIDPFRRDCLLGGLDDIALTLRHADALAAFTQQHDAKPWLQARA
jgi:3-isopropylmalate/(R)-2-methylmalate dehydratase small subunit